MRNFILGFALALTLAAGVYWIASGAPPGGSRAVSTEVTEKYHCPMHPTYVSEKPGDCPICGMRLVPVRDATPDRPAGGGSGHEHGLETRVDGPFGPPDKSAEEVAVTPGVPGYSAVVLPADRQQLMGVKLADAEAVTLEQSIRTFGRVTYDERRLHHVHTKFGGYIEKLHANYVGQFVKKGEPLFSVYSPELYATQREYLLALRAREQWGDLAGQGTGPTVDLVGAARRRLELWDIGEAEIKRLEQVREPQRDLTVLSPVTGFVMAKTAVSGLRVMPGDTLYDIIDLSSVWVMADIYEVNLPFVRVGQRAELLLPFQPGTKFSGRVTYIDPMLDEKTRTVKARVEFSNPRGVLKPEMYGDVLIRGSLGSGVAVPDDAVISTGERDIVFVARENGVFEPREVVLGVKVRNLYEIKEGVTAGEQVVTGANFLLDSESKLKATLAARSSGDDRHEH